MQPNSIFFSAVVLKPQKNPTKLAFNSEFSSQHVRNHSSVKTRQNAASNCATPAYSKTFPIQRTVTVSFDNHFYPRDAMLARVLAMALCLSVCLCLPATSRCSIKRGERISVFFGMKASFNQSHSVLRKFGYLNSGLKKCRHGISIVERAINLARESWTLTAW